MEETTSSAAATDPNPPNLEEITDKSKISATKDNLDSLQASKDNNNDFEQFTSLFQDLPSEHKKGTSLPPKPNASVIRAQQSG
jgi:hypothetical protein